MGNVDSNLKIQNRTCKCVSLHFKSMDKFDYCGDLYNFNVLEGREIRPGEDQSVKLRINAKARGCMFTLDTKIGCDKVSLRIDQKISLMEKNFTKIDFKDKTFTNILDFGKIHGNGEYGCMGDVKKYDLTAFVADDRTLVITFEDKHDHHDGHHHEHWVPPIAICPPGPPHGGCPPHGGPPHGGPPHGGPPHGGCPSQGGPPPGSFQPC